MAVPHQEPNIGLDTNVSTNAVKQLYLNKKAADVFFVFQSGERVPAHKGLLVTASEVFDIMFYGSVPQEDDVKIVDASVTAFKEFLQFFYSTSVQLSMENIGEVVYLCNKYGMTSCLETCCNFLVVNLKVDNVCQIYGLAILYDRQNLMELCESEISVYAKEVFKTAGFLDCSLDVLVHILKLNVLSCSEVDVFEACMSWTKHTSKSDELTRDIVHEHMGISFYSIRYRSMTNDEFVSLIPSYGNLFIGDDFIEILQLMKNRKFQPKLFNGNKRLLLLANKAQIMINRFVGYLEHWSKLEKVETVKLSTNKSFLLSSIAYASIFDENGKKFEKPVPILMTITSRHGHRVLENEETEINVQAFTLVRLSRPVLIRSGVEYEVRFDLPHPVWCYAKLKSQIEVKPDIIVKFQRVSSDANSNNSGLLSRIHIHRVALK